MTRTIGVLVFPNFQLLDAPAPTAPVELANREIDPSAYRLCLLAAGAGQVTSSSGITLLAESGAGAPMLDTLIVAGGLGAHEPEPSPEMLGLIRDAAACARRVTSVCTGAFLLAAAGLLDGKRATTHWRWAADLARLYPQIQVEPDRIFVRDGNVWTSAGITAGIDLALALIAEDLGEAAAKRTAQRLVVYHRRPGGQSQFSALLELGRPDGGFCELLGRGRERLGGAARGGGGA